MIPASALRRQWRYMPDRATITLKPQTALGIYGSVSVADAWWRAGGGTQEYAPSLSVVTAAHRLYYFPKEKYSGVPAVGDLIVNPVTAIDPAAVTWTVTGTNDVGGLGAWELSCISLQIAAALKNLAVFSRPDTTQDAAGRPAPNYTPYASAVPSRFQPQGGDAGDVFDRITIPKEWTCYLAYFVDVRAKDRVTDGTNTYTVLGTSKPSRLDELQEVRLQVIS